MSVKLTTVNMIYLYLFLTQNTKVISKKEQTLTQLPIVKIDNS